MQTLFQIGIPTINRCDLLNPALQEYVDRFPNTRIHVWDNGAVQGIMQHPNVIVHRSDTNIGVSGAWNKLCELIFWESSHAIILNDDVVLKSTEEEICKYVSENKFDFLLWCGFSSFLFPKQTFESIGDFDEKFYPAYFEDNDYIRRLIVAKKNIIHHDVLEFIEVEKSGSIKKNPSLNHLFETNRQYYHEKWGGSPWNETYLTPFNK